MLRKLPGRRTVQAARSALRAALRRVRRCLARFRRVEVDTQGDGFFATFDGPARAIRCACAIRDPVADGGIEIRAGLHTGEVERRGGACRWTASPGRAPQMSAGTDSAETSRARRQLAPVS